MVSFSLGYSSISNKLFTSRKNKSNENFFHLTKFL